MKELIRKDVASITAYSAGKPIEETKRQLGLKSVIKLASNENPLGPCPKAIAAIRKCACDVNRYPDSNGFYLKRKLAKHWRVEASNIVLGNGSDEIIDIAVKTFVEPDEEVLTSECTFLEYKINSQINGRAVTAVPLKYFKYDLDAMRKRINRKTKLVFIANPNNPTGTYVTKMELQDFIDGLPSQVVVVLDEAYDIFVDVNDFPNSLAYLNKKNVIILKTFSKAWGLAGLRLGYAIAQSDVIGYMERVRQPFNVNSLAQAAAVACLEDKSFLKRTRRVTLEGKKFLYDSLKNIGLTFVPSAANFILINVEKDGLTVFKEMLKLGVIVRDMSQYGLKNFIRVTIGTKKENERFVKALEKVL